MNELDVYKKALELACIKVCKHEPACPNCKEDKNCIDCTIDEYLEKARKRISNTYKYTYAYCNCYINGIYASFTITVKYYEGCPQKILDENVWNYIRFKFSSLVISNEEPPSYIHDDGIKNAGFDLLIPAPR